jgi:hypothetical protein
MNYLLLNGTPAVVVPVKLGAPLMAWDGLTLEQLWKVELPPEGSETSSSGRYEGIVNVLFEYLDLCIDWERILLQGTGDGKEGGDDGKLALKDALKLLVAGAVRSGESKAVKKEVDEARSGVAMWRIP